MALWLWDTFVRRLQKFADQQPFIWFGLTNNGGEKEGNPISHVIDQKTYAVVTFTSRQAAITARQCMADGSGLGWWEAMEDLPVPPLADSPPWDLSPVKHAVSCCVYWVTVHDVANILTCFFTAITSRPPRDPYHQWQPKALPQELVCIELCLLP